MRKLTDKDVTFTIECLPEDLPIDGHCMASGNDQVDRECAQWIYDQLDRGNEWAWCTVRITATWNSYRGVDYLGACSYLSQEDFKQGGYYEDMKAVALTDLNEAIARDLQRASETVQLLTESV